MVPESGGVFVVANLLVVMEVLMTTTCPVGTAPSRCVMREDTRLSRRPLRSSD